MEPYMITKNVHPVIPIQKVIPKTAKKTNDKLYYFAFTPNDEFGEIYIFFNLQKCKFKVITPQQERLVKYLHFQNRLVNI